MEEYVDELNERRKELAGGVARRPGEHAGDPLLFPVPSVPLRVDDGCPGVPAGRPIVAGPRR